MTTTPSAAIGKSKVQDVRLAPPVVLAGHCGGEPSIDLDGKGHVYVTGLRGSLEGDVQHSGMSRCTGSTSTEVSSAGVPYWVSSNNGHSFGPKQFTGSWFNGSDSDVAVDRSSGDVYVADGPYPDANPHTTICRSQNHGGSWTTVFTGAESCATPITLTGQVLATQDRPWINYRAPTPAHPHHDLFLTVGVGVSDPVSATYPGLLNTGMYLSRDARPFLPIPGPATAPGYPAETGDSNGGHIGRPVLGPDGDLYLTWLTSSRKDPGPQTELWFAKLHHPGDSDQAWTLVKVHDATDVSGSSASSMSALWPNIAVDGSGRLYIVFVGDITGASPNGTGALLGRAYLWSSADDGAHWRGPTKLTTDRRARALPAIYGGPRRGELVIGWYRSLTGSDPCDAHSKWGYDVVESRNADSRAPTFTTAHVDHVAVVHHGGVLGSGNSGGCANSNLYDFSSIAVDQRGCAIAAYTDDHRVVADQSNKRWDLIDNVVVRQTTGCFR